LLTSLPNHFVSPTSITLSIGSSLVFRNYLMSFDVYIITPWAILTVMMVKISYHDRYYSRTRSLKKTFQGVTDETRTLMKIILMLPKDT